MQEIHMTRRTVRSAPAKNALPTKPASGLGADRSVRSPIGAKRETRASVGHMADKSQAVAIGSQMRIERRRLRLTLDALADLTGLNKGYLSRIERGQKAPALATVLKLAAAFDVSVPELLGERLTAQTVRITRSGAGRQLLGKGDGFEMLVPGSPIFDVVIVRPDSEFGAERLREHAGEEVLYVLEGTIELSFPSRKVLLKSGDCARFPGHLRHRMRRVGRHVAAALVIVVNSNSAPDMRR
jgi:transcriptional regulator with XRE-family HTH domain